MTQQYIRKVSLVVGDAGGNGLDLSALQFKFETRRGDYQTPNQCVARVYNLSENTVKALQAKEFTRLILKAGYEGSYGVIFDGTIKYKYKGHESNVDSYLDLIAADGDSYYTQAVVSKTLAAGSTPQQHFNAVLSATNATASPSQPPLTSPPLPRGKVLFGMARDALRKIANNTNCSWSIQDGQVQFISQNAYIPGDPVKLTYATGLVGFPEQTLNGLIIRSLLNPNLKIGTVVQLDNGSVQPFELDVTLQSTIQQNFLDLMKDNDGKYKVLIAEHTGDTRGNPFYTKLTCIGVNGSIPPGSPLFYQQAVSPYFGP